MNDNRANLQSLNFPQSIISEITSDPTKIDSMSLPGNERAEALNAYGKY